MTAQYDRLSAEIPSPDFVAHVARMPPKKKDEKPAPEPQDEAEDKQIAMETELLITVLRSKLGRCECEHLPLVAIFMRFSIWLWSV